MLMGVASSVMALTFSAWVESPKQETFCPRRIIEFLWRKCDLGLLHSLQHLVQMHQVLFIGLGVYYNVIDVD